MGDDDRDGSYSTHGPPRRDGDERDVETNAQGRNPGRGGRVEVQGELDGVRCDLEHGIDGEHVGLDRRRGRMAGATLLHPTVPSQSRDSAMS